MPNFTYFNTLFLLVWLQVINKVKFIHQGEGHIKVKVKYLHSFKFYVRQQDSLRYTSRKSAHVKCT